METAVLWSGKNRPQDSNGFTQQCSRAGNGPVVSALEMSSGGGQPCALERCAATLT
jgi:hypothetical protein